VPEFAIEKSKCCRITKGRESASQFEWVSNIEDNQRKTDVVFDKSTRGRCIHSNCNPPTATHNHKQKRGAGRRREEGRRPGCQLCEGRFDHIGIGMACCKRQSVSKRLKNSLCLTLLPLQRRSALLGCLRYLKAKILHVPPITRTRASGNIPPKITCTDIPKIAAFSRRSCY
jgi:hypothetical protein